MATSKDFKLRSLRNIEAARSLQREPNLAGPCASRAYYAWFQALVAEYIEAGKKPSDLDPGEHRWRHHGVRRSMELLPRVKPELKLAKAIYKELQEFREIADYGPGVVEHFEVCGAFTKASDFMNRMHGRSSGQSMKGAP